MPLLGNAALKLQSAHFLAKQVGIASKAKYTQPAVLGAMGIGGAAAYLGTDELGGPSQDEILAGNRFSTKRTFENMSAYGAATAGALGLKGAISRIREAPTIPRKLNAGLGTLATLSIAGSLGYDAANGQIPNLHRAKERTLPLRGVSAVSETGESLYDMVTNLM